MDIRPLPPNKTATQVLSDFLRYLLLCAREFITEAHPNGIALWNSVKDTMEFVLTHPNGWAGRQQTLIRRAAVLAELIGDTLEDHSRISFATEGEGVSHTLRRREARKLINYGSVATLLHSTWTL